MPEIATDVADGVVTMLSSSETAVRTGVPIHQYPADRDMHRIFWDADGELLIVPQLGRLATMFESHQVLRPTPHALSIPQPRVDYDSVWNDLGKTFTGGRQ